MIRPPPTSPLFPYTTLFRSRPGMACRFAVSVDDAGLALVPQLVGRDEPIEGPAGRCTAREQGQAIGPVGRVRVGLRREDRKSTRLNSSHVKISYAVFCLKKK